MLSTALFCVTLLSAFEHASAADVLNVNAWQTEKGKYPSLEDFPESAYDDIMSRPNTAIAFSGGGSRSYAATMGYLAGLNELGLMENVRYISGISGGSWATSVYSYAQTDVPDDVMLGPIVAPSDIVYDQLHEMDPLCVRAYTNSCIGEIAIMAIKNDVPGVDKLADGWAYGVQTEYLDPVGITAGAHWSWNEASVADIKRRNPSLKDEKFLLPAKPTRPFMVLGSAAVGPADHAPYPTKAHNFTMIELTPLYVGNAYSMDVDYQDGNKLVHTEHIHKPETLTIGGYVETFGFGRSGDAKGSAPLVGLKDDETAGTLRVPAPVKPLDIQYAASASGYAPAAFFESSHVPGIAETFGLHFSYWSPSERVAPKASDMLYTDGGCLSDVMLMSFLQRRVSNIVLFLNKHTPMLPASDWNVDVDEPSGDQIDDGFQAYFGIVPPAPNKIVERSFQIEKNQVFATEDFYPVVHAMQAAQAEGRGVVHSVNLTTVENAWWGIPAGFTAEITFVYLSRLSTWEAELSEEMQSMVVPDKGDPADMSNTISHGVFKGYPHYFTAGGLQTHQQTNLLADMSGWVIQQNKELFKRILS